MFILDEKNPESKLNQKVLVLMISRLLVIFLLLLGAWVWNSDFKNISLNLLPQGLFYVFITSVVFTIFYVILWKFIKNLANQVRFQFLIDSFLITWLVWQTGDVSSPYITLYTVLICVSSIFFGLRETLILTIICVAMFTFLFIATSYNFIHTFSDSNIEIRKAVQMVGFHDIAILVVGFLAAKLAERRPSNIKLQETKKTLEDLRTLHERIVESIRSGLITTDLEGKIFTFNATAEEITGYRANDIRSSNIFDLIGDIHQPIAVSLEAVKNNEPPPRYEIDFKTPDGFLLRIGYGISPLFAETGETRGLIITFQDLTEIRSMEENVRRKDRLAAVGRIAAGLAHEIRNPLGAMRGAIQVLQSNTEPNSSQARLMDIILRESDRLNNFITNFLIYARPRVSNFTETDLNEVIKDAFTLLKHSPDIKEIHELNLDLPNEPMLVSADSAQLKQVFWNLTRNAIQAMQKGGKLSVKLQKLNTGRTQIIFSDTGIGMSRSQVEQLFEPFSGSTTGGTGLGLSIVYQIVRDHGGTINVRSLEGSGTTITIELPSETKPQITPDLDESATIPSRLESFLSVKSNE